MKKIIIEISASQHEEMQSYLEKCCSTSASEDCRCAGNDTFKLQKDFLRSTLNL